jgi:hypothetical protein
VRTFDKSSLDSLVGRRVRLPTPPSSRPVPTMALNSAARGPGASSRPYQPAKRSKRISAPG